MIPCQRRTNYRIKNLIALVSLIVVFLLSQSAFSSTQAKPAQPTPVDSSFNSAVALSNLSVAPAYFNSTTGSVTLTYTLSGDTVPVKLEVLNASSVVVRTIDAGTKAPGTYTIVWDGKNDAGAAVGEGSYTLRLTAGSTQYTFLSKWGSLGSGDGQFLYPTAIAVDSSGNVYVTDYLTHYIQKFTASGTFLAKWGSFGTGDGQFDNPRGVAVDSSGNVYVTDYNNHRIQKFTASGTFITQWGTQGSGDGQFYAPTGVAVDSSGNVYVADLNHRIQKFTATGTFITKWGSYGYGDGQFDAPWGVAVDSSGNVYVADFGIHRIRKFTSTGTFIAKWGTLGSGDGQFDNPRGVAVDSSNNVYVPDTDNHRIQKFSSSGTFVAKWGSEGTGDGQFNAPTGVVVDSSGNVYVTDRDNHRIQKFAREVSAHASATVDNTPPTAPTNLTKTTLDNNNTPNFTWTASTDATSGLDYYQARVDSGTWSNIGNVTTYTWPTALSDSSHTFEVKAVDKAGNAGTAASLNFNISTLALSNLSISPAYLNSTTGSITLTYTLSGGTVPVKLEVLNASSQVVRTIDAGSKAPGTYTIAWNGKNDGGAAVGEGSYTLRLTAGSTQYTFVTKWGSKGSGIGQLDEPWDLAVDNNGNVYIVDYSNNRVQKFTSNGSFITEWGSLGYGDSQFKFPTGVSVDTSGNIIVVDSFMGRIKRFTPSGVFITKWGEQGSGDGQFTDPGGVAIDGNGNVYIADYGNHRIQKFTSDGTFITKWGSLGSGDSQFEYPQDIAVDTDGNIYVADSHNHRIQKFTSSGVFITKWGAPNMGPTHLTVDVAGNIYVTEPTKYRIMKYTASGNIITQLGSQGIGDGQFVSPLGVAVDSSGNVYVSETGGNTRIQKFAPPTGTVTGQASVTVDAIPPTTPTNLTKTTPDTDSTPTFTWTAATDTGSGLDYYQARMDSGSWTNIGNVTTYTWPTALNDGSHTIELKAVDKAGNTGSAASLSFTISTAVYSVQWGAHSTPTSIKPGQMVGVNITLTNTGSLTWPKSGANPVYVTYHWYNASWQPVEWGIGLRSSFSTDVASGQTVSVTASLKAPSTAGTYNLFWDVVHEGVTWFSAQGAPLIAVSGINVAATQAKDVQWVSHTTPTTIKPGQMVGVPITLTNTGSLTWPKNGANPVYVTYHWYNTSWQPVEWGIGLRSSFASDVASGQTVSITASLKAPSTPGTYNLFWDVVHEGVTWFSAQGAPLIAVSGINVAATQAKDVQWVSHTTPTTIKPGQMVGVPITLTNTGSFTWPKGGANPVYVTYHWYNASWQAVEWGIGLRSSFSQDVPSGQMVSLTASLKAPSTAGTYNLLWDVVHEGVTWFSAQGAPLMGVTGISIATSQAKDVQWVSHNTPTSLTAGQTLGVSITLTNTGSQSWPQGGANPVKISYHWLNPATGAAVVWDGQMTNLSADVSIGQMVTLSASLQAPSTTGSYTLAWDMVQVGVAWFSGQGAPLLAVSPITVN